MAICCGVKSTGSKQPNKKKRSDIYFTDDVMKILGFVKEENGVIYDLVPDPDFNEGFDVDEIELKKPTQKVGRIFHS